MAEAHVEGESGDINTARKTFNAISGKTSSHHSSTRSCAVGLVEPTQLLARSMAELFVRTRMERQLRVEMRTASQCKECDWTARPATTITTTATKQHARLKLTTKTKTTQKTTTSKTTIRHLSLSQLNLRNAKATTSDTFCPTKQQPGSLMTHSS